jgi:2'-5' RNA ligase
MMRAFLAVELAAEVHHSVVSGMAELRRALPPARWVRPEGVHITLKFLGEQPEELLHELGGQAAGALAGVAPVAVRLAGGGFFPGPRRPRVAWLGGSAEGMERWAAALEECAAGLGLAREERPFSLHVTLARLDRPWHPDAVESFLTQVGRWQLPPFVARDVALFASELRPSGAIYTPLRRLAVGS